MDSAWSAVVSGSVADADTSSADPVLILAPPGCGKTYYIAKKKRAGEAQKLYDWHGYPEKGFPKIASKRVRVVLREMEEYKKRCETRTERPVHPDHCERCWACLDQLARDNELKTYPSVEAAVAAA